MPFPVHTPAPRPIRTLTRVELTGRIHALRDALETLWAQTEVDRAEAFACTGAIKVELLAREAQLRVMDSINAAVQRASA